MSLILKCTKSAISRAAKTLLDGNLVAFPTETVYGLGGDALNQKAINRIYNVKARPKNHPLIVHISSLDYLNQWARNIPAYAIQLAKNFWPGPMTLILPRTSLVKDFISGGQDCVGIRIPDQIFALALLKEFEKSGGLGVAAPSANRFGKVSPTSAEDVEEELVQYLKIKDIILDGGTCAVGLESTIIDCRLNRPKILRPGAISPKMIEESCGIKLVKKQRENLIRVSGSFMTHYAPDAQVYLNGHPSEGDGFIALNHIQTPKGAIRLASPKNNIQYAQILYRALRLADQKQIKKVYVVPPGGDDIALAINDRLFKAISK